jgi:hypothetical protein
MADITQTIIALPQAGHRGVDTRDVFVTKQEAFQDALQGTTVTQLNTFATQANALRTEVNQSKADAATSANTATTQAGVATTQAGIATTKASEASSSAGAALTYRNDTATIYDNFDDRYLGNKATDPTLDNDGQTLLEGALYWNTVDKRLKIYNGVGWNYAASDAVIQTATTGSAKLPIGTTSQRDATPQEGYLRFNNETHEYEGYKNGQWQSVGGGQMLGQSLVKAISYNAQTISETIVIPSGVNAYSVGSVTLTAGGNIVISAGSVYKIL